MAYLGVFRGFASKLRNSLSRREFFRQGDEYYRAFNLRGEEGESQPGPLPELFEPDEDANHRALQILVARCLEESCRSGIAAIGEKHEKNSLKKGAFYLAGIIYLKNKCNIDDMINSASTNERRAEVARKLIDAVALIGKDTFDDARRTFNNVLEEYLAGEGGNEDAALKNSKFAEEVNKKAKEEI